MKKLITLLAMLGIVFAPQARASLADEIAEAEAVWLIASWESEIDGNSVSLSFKWVIKDHVLGLHFKGNNNETYSLIALNPESGEVEQTGYGSSGRKSTGKWGPKGDMPMVTLTSKNDEGNSRSMGVAFRRIDHNNIEMQIYSVDANGDVGDFAEFSTEMKRAKEKKK